MQYLMCLIVIADLHIRSKTDRAGICLDKVIDDLKDRRLAGAVIADDGNTLATFELKADIGEKNLTVKGFAEMLDRKDIVAALDPRGEQKVHAGIFLNRFVETFYLVELFLAAFRTFDRFLAVKGFKLGNDSLLMLDLCLLVQVLLHLCIKKSLFFLGKLAVISLING